MQSSHSHIARISRRITPTPGHDHRFSGMLFFPSLFRSRSAIRSRDLPPISPRCARDTNLRLVAQHRVNPVRDPAGAAHVLALHARRRRARLLLPGLVGRRDHQAPAPPAPPGRGLQPGRREPADLVAAASRDAWFSSRCIRSGDRSPACSAVVRPFRFGSSLASAETYFAGCSHVCVRAKQPRSAPASSARFRTASPAPILAAAAASGSFVLPST